MSRPTKERLAALFLVNKQGVKLLSLADQSLLFAEMDALTADLEAAYRQGRVDQAREDAALGMGGSDDVTAFCDDLKQRAAELEREGKDK